MRPKSSIALIATGLLLAAPIEASAFSQIGREDGSAPAQDGVIATPLPPLNPPGTSSPVDDAAAQPPTGDATDARGADQSAPRAAPSPSPADTAPGAPAETPSATEEDESGTGPAASQAATPEEPTGPPPDVFYGDAELPTPVRDLRAKLIEIAKSGEVEKLRPYLETGENGTVLSFGGVEGDPIDFLKSSSGDGEGVETLAILLEVLEAGHIKSEPGTDGEIYVWPYFAGLAVEKLTKPQKVELFELVTAGDYQEMVAFGAYNFYRVGISPDGKLQFFVAGD